MEGSRTQRQAGTVTAGSPTFLRQEVLPYVPDAWYSPGAVNVGYEVSFTRHFYRPLLLHTLNEIRAHILTLEQETRGLVEEIVSA